MSILNAGSKILGGATALGGAIYSAIKSKQYNDKANSLIQQQRDDNQKWYDIKSNEDYLNRSDSQAVLDRQRELLQEQYSQSRATNAVTGGTDESLARQQQAATDSLAKTASNIASQASSYKDQVDAQYRANDAALNQQQVQVNQNQANAVAQAGGQAVSAGLNLMGQSMNSDDETLKAIIGGAV